MEKLKVGDKVKILWGNTIYLADGYRDQGIVCQVDGDYGVHVRGFYRRDEGFSLFFASHRGCLVKLCGSTARKVGFMSRLSLIAKRMLDGDTQALYKAGFISESLWLTDEGKSNLWAILLEAYKKEMVAAAKQELKDRKDNDE